MAYATVTDVNERIVIGGFQVDGSSSPSSTTVGNWLDQFSALVDGALTVAGYGTVPATGATDLLILKHIVANKAALMTLFVAFGIENVPESMVTQLDGFEAALKALREGDMLLVDQSTDQGIFTLGFLNLRLNAEDD